jgi:hypothetical protein
MFFHGLSHRIALGVRSFGEKRADRHKQGSDQQHTPQSLRLGKQLTQQRAGRAADGGQGGSLSGSRISTPLISAARRIFSGLNAAAVAMSVATDAVPMTVPLNNR